MDLSRLASFKTLLIVGCGDVERNPGPPKKEACKSEVLRQFMRCIQSDVVKLVYEAYQQEPPKQLYKKAPPGWDAFDEDIEFKNICNSKKEGNKTFDKLVKLCKKEAEDLIPKNVSDVIVCYENLRDSKKDSDDTKLWKLALQNYVSQNKSIKNKSTVIDQVDEKFLIEVIKKGTERVKQGHICSSSEGMRDISRALNDFITAVVKNTEQILKKPNTAGKKRPVTAEDQDTMSKMELFSVRKKMKLLDSVYAHAETFTEKEKPKPELSLPPPPYYNEILKSEDIDLQDPERHQVFYPKPSNSLPQMKPPHVKPQQVKQQQMEQQQVEQQQMEQQQVEQHQMEQQQVEQQQMEQQQQVEQRQMEQQQQVEQRQMEQQQVEQQQMEQQQVEQQQMEQQQVEQQQMEQEIESQLPLPPSPYCDGILESEDIDLQGGSTKTIPMVQNTSDMICTLPTQQDSTDCLSESTFEDEALKSMPLEDVIRNYLY